MTKKPTINKKINALMNLNVKDIDKSNNFENKSFIENGNLLADDFEFSEFFIKYFQNLVSNLDLKVQSKLLCQTPENGD